MRDCIKGRAQSKSTYGKQSRSAALTRSVVTEYCNAAKNATEIVQTDDGKVRIQQAFLLQFFKERVN